MINYCEYDQQVREIATAPSIYLVQPHRSLLALELEGAPGGIRARPKPTEHNWNQVEVRGTFARAIASREQANENSDVNDIVGDDIQRAAEIALIHLEA